MTSTSHEGDETRPSTSIPRRGRWPGPVPARCRPMRALAEPLLFVRRLESRANATRKVEARLKELKARDRLWRRVKRTFLGLYMVHWLVIFPMIISHVEEWTFVASFYFTVQSGTGIGFGALTLKGEGMKAAMVVHLVSGAVLVTMAVSTVLSSWLARAEERAKAPASASQAAVDLGVGAAPWQGLAIGACAVALVLVAGVFYGVVYEQWSFITSLFFIVSLCQTSGLQAPSVTPASGAWPCLFVAALCLVGVPLWAYVVGASASYLAQRERQRQNLLDALNREQRAESSFIRHAHDHHQLDVRPDTILSRSMFLELFLLRNGLVSEDVLWTVDEEFEQLRKSGTLTLQRLTMRLQQLQKEELKL